MLRALLVTSVLGIAVIVVVVVAALRRARR